MWILLHAPTRGGIALVIMRELARLVSKKMRNTNEEEVLLFKALVDEVLAEDTD